MNMVGKERVKAKSCSRELRLRMESEGEITRSVPMEDPSSAQTNNV